MQDPARLLTREELPAQLVPTGQAARAWKIHKSLFSQARTTFQRSPAELADNERRSVRPSLETRSASQSLTLSILVPPPRAQLVGDTVIKLCLTVMMDSSLQPGAITVRFPAALSYSDRNYADRLVPSQSIKGALESNVVHARHAVLYGLHLELQAHGAQAAIIRFNPSQQADVFEAFVGAVYESHGHAATEGLSRGNGIFGTFEPLSPALVAIRRLTRLSRLLLAKRPRPHLDEAGRAEQKCRLMRCLR